MARFLISAIGSHGDVHPVVGLGMALAERGHEVKLITNPYFADMVAAAGLELLPLDSREVYERVSQHPDLWHPLRGPRMVLSQAAGGYARTLYELAVANHLPGETVFCAHPLDLGSRVAGEQLGVPVAAIEYCPATLWTVHDSPRLCGTVIGRGVPKWVKRLQFRATDALFVQPLLGGPLNRLRRELGMPPVRRIFGQWRHATQMVLGLFPDWFGPPQPDWPANTRLTGFPLWDANADAELPSALERFLADGNPPIAFSPGSANREAKQFFTAAVEACNGTGLRGILLTKYTDQLPANLPPSVAHFGFIPLRRLLPQAAALVHHGGIGSCAQGLAAGVPQLVRPMAYDQFDNARRLVRLGVAEEISVNSFSATTIHMALERLLDTAAIASNCRALAAKCDGPASLRAACIELERLTYN